MRLILTTILYLTFTYSIGQNYWSESKNSTNSRSTSLIQTSKSKVYELDKNAFKANFQINNVINIPLPDGTFMSFKLTESRTMSEGLKLKYPNIKVYNGTSSDGKYSGNFDITKKGFHAMIKSSEGLFYIDPVASNSNTYQVYNKSDFINSKTSTTNDDVLVNESKITLTNERLKSTSSRSSGTELRTYRMAITCTGEYASFHGGTVEDALSAIVTTMNRVNGIYEREVGIALELIADTDLLLYTNSSTDPYTNSDAGSYIDEVQNNIDDIIGNANYDIGHGFSTGAGGLAGPGPCITGRKATGVTGTNSPVGDPYDVDYVAHEVGHQFGANHTFNGSTGSCTGGNRNAGTAYEPGSGTTILAYAGICTPQNIQSNSDAFMHSASFDEILDYSVVGSGNTCPVVTSTGNTPPTSDAGTSGFSIPISTPFTLTGSGSDVDGHDLTYSWEQFDLGPTGEPNEPVDNAPIFRSFSPVDIPSRTFPQLSDILNNTQTIGEILPDYERSLSFRFTVRDNQNGGGGVSYDELSFEVTESAGPFIVESFNSSEEVSAQSNVTITWDVAGTDQAPVNCQFVNVLLSEDGGNTFPYTLKSNTSNDGSELVLIPDITTSTARIKVEAADNVFFDINDGDFSIVTPTEPDYNINVLSSTNEVCAPSDGLIELNIGSVLSYTDDVTLSLDGLTDGLTALFSSNPVTPGDDVTIQIQNTDLGADGTYDLTLNISSTSGSREIEFSISIYDEDIEVVNQSSPLDNATNVELLPILNWDDLPGLNTYEVDIATDIDFNNIIQSETDISSNSFQSNKLDGNTTYFWRVKGSNSCKTTDYSITSFTTVEIVCNEKSSTDLPKEIISAVPNTVTSTIDITNCGALNGIQVIGLKGTHTYLGDLEVSITSPSGTTVTLFSGICGSSADFDLSFDEYASNTSVNCPATDQNFYQPEESFEAFYGEEINGYWTLTINDLENNDGGFLNEWSLELCVLNNINVPTAPSELTGNVVEGSQIDLTWTDNSNDETNFVIERSKLDNNLFEKIDTVDLNVSTFSDFSLSEDDTYLYRIKAFNSECISLPSNVAEIEFLKLPDAPSNLVLNLVSLERIDLTWKDNSNNESSFFIERSEGDNTNYILVDEVTENAKSYSDVSMSNPNVYYYRVYAANSTGTSAPTSEVSVSSIVLAIEESTDNYVIIYPNPGNGLYHVSMNGTNINSIQVFDLLGNLILSEEVSGNNHEFNLSLNTKGIYILHLNSKDESITKKIILE